MQKILTLFILLGLSGCMFVPVHKMDIEQGNIVTPEMASRIHTGMSEGQVTSIMGNPVLLNTFADNRENYVYTFKPGYGRGVERYLSLTFRGGRLVEINKVMDVPFGN